MYNSLRLTLVLVLAPMLAMAQAENSAPCPDVTLNLSELKVLDDVRIETLAELKELKQLAVLESLSDLDVMSDMTLDIPVTKLSMAEINDMVEVCQTGDAEMAAFDAEKRKTIDKTFKVSSKDALRIENQWGKVHVNTWEKNEIQVKVEVIARAESDAKAQEILDNISILESHDGNAHSFRTKKESMNISKKQSLEINYTVYMPAENAIAVKNQFGDVYLASIKGKADIDVKYGAFKCDRLSNTANTVKIAYGSGNCAYISGGNISVAYSDMKVGGAGDLQGSSAFSDFSLGGLEETMEMNVKYGNFKVDNISSKVRKISLTSGFTPVSLNFAENPGFNFDVNVKFGNFNVDKSLVTITSLEKDYTSAEYKGRFGGASPKGVISINSKYGDVKFTK